MMVPPARTNSNDNTTMPPTFVGVIVLPSISRSCTSFGAASAVSAATIGAVLTASLVRSGT